MKKYISLLKCFFRSSLTQNHENTVELCTFSWFLGFSFVFWKHKDIVHVYIYMNVYYINLHKLYQIISPTSLYTSSLNKISCVYTPVYGGQNNRGAVCGEPGQGIRYIPPGKGVSANLA